MLTIKVYTTSLLVLICYGISLSSCSSSASSSGSSTNTNQSPRAQDDELRVRENVSLDFTTADLLANDSDPDNDSLSITSFNSSNTSGTLVQSGSQLTYTPPSDFTGNDSFGYVLSDGERSTTGQVNITIADEALTIRGVEGLLETQGRETITAEISWISSAGEIAWTSTSDHIFFTSPNQASTDIIAAENGTYRVTITVTDGAEMTMASMDFQANNSDPFQMNGEVQDNDAAAQITASLRWLRNNATIASEDISDDGLFNFTGLCDDIAQYELILPPQN